jgi:hypothetical protein
MIFLEQFTEIEFAVTQSDIDDGEPLEINQMEREKVVVLSNRLTRYPQKA